MTTLRSTGRRFPARWERVLLRGLARLRRGAFIHVELDDEGYRSIFACENAEDASRPLSLWIKEEGTMQWISSDTRAGDVFMDIGANIGIYAIAAGHRVGSEGQVYAFEPHKVNALSLMRNIQLSKLSDRVKVFACALAGDVGVFEFNYRSLASASSTSQLGHRYVAGEGSFEPVASEMVFASTVDRLVGDGVMRPPHLIKIDVDGNEVQILKGMAALLSSADRPRAVQVELNVGEQDQVIQLLAGLGYRLDQRHFTHLGKKALARGLPLDRVAHNAIFRPVQTV